MSYPVLGQILFSAVMHLKDSKGMANSVDPDQTAPLGAVLSGSSLFAQKNLAQYLEFLGLVKNFFD